MNRQVGPNEGHRCQPTSSDDIAVGLAVIVLFQHTVSLPTKHRVVETKTLNYMSRRRYVRWKERWQ
jgi:hypothetical protein